MMRKLLLGGALSVVLTAAGVVASAPPATAGLPDLLRTTRSTLSTTDAVKGVTLACPRGMRLVSGGGEIVGGGANVRFTRMEPDEPTASYRVEAEAVAAGVSGPWSLTASVICTAGSVWPPSVEHGSFFGSNAGQTAVAECDRDDTLVGMGAKVTAVGGTPNVALTLLQPSVDLDKVIVQAYELRGGESRNWRLDAYAICTDPLEWAHVVTNHVGPASAEQQSVSATCDVGEVHGVGGGVLGAGATAFPTKIASESLEVGRVIAHEDAVGTPTNWLADVFVICA